MEKLIKQLKDSWDSLNVDTGNFEENHKQLQAASTILDTAVDVSFLNRKKADLDAILGYILKVLVRHGDLISNDQAMTIDNYFLGKIWADIIYGATSESGYCQSSIYVYSNHKDAEDDRIDSKKVLDFLSKLKQEVLGVSKYSSLILLLYVNQKSFLNLDLKK